MQITHVIRGEEWLPSSPLHVLLYRYLGWENEMPQFAHLPLLLKPDGKGKLSKRDGDRLGFPVFPLNWKDPRTGEIYNGFREAGYFPEAVVNFLALLGWNPGTEQEIFSMDELIEQFSLERVSKSGAKFDYEKAKWFNHKYLQMKPDEEVADIFQRILIEKGFVEDTDKVIKIISLIKDRADFITDLWDQSHYFFEAPVHYDAKAVQKRWKPEIPEQLEELGKMLLSLEATSAEEMEKSIKEWISEKNYHLGNLMNALRLALVGELKGPSIFEIVEVLGKEETVRRIKKAIEVLSGESL
jgi:glutamyl-tRNA synthetase